MNPPAERLEYLVADAPCFNYCLWPYEPRRPVAGKFAGVNLLYQSFAEAGIDPRAYDLVDRIRAGIGPFRTVFGIKWAAGRLSWEFYFYDYARREREVSISRVLDVVRPLAPCGIRVNESLPYFMFSLDVDDALLTGRRDIDVVHMYVGNPGSTVSSGIAYGVRATATTLENFYFFFDAEKQLADAAAKIACSARLDATRIDVNRILHPEFRACRTICVANKQAADTVYFSEVDVDQLLSFLRTLDYPPGTIRFVESNRALLDHLRYDVGFDYVADEADIRVVKGGFYGVF
jgi:hypothetical protein